jgi:hypothetical protein
VKDLVGRLEDLVKTGVIGTEETGDEQHDMDISMSSNLLRCGEISVLTFLTVLIFVTDFVLAGMVYLTELGLTVLISLTELRSYCTDMSYGFILTVLILSY